MTPREQNSKGPFLVLELSLAGWRRGFHLAPVGLGAESAHHQLRRHLSEGRFVAPQLLGLNWLPGHPSSFSDSPNQQARLTLKDGKKGNETKDEGARRTPMAKRQTVELFVSCSGSAELQLQQTLQTVSCCQLSTWFKRGVAAFQCCSKALARPRKAFMARRSRSTADTLETRGIHAEEGINLINATDVVL